MAFEARVRGQPLTTNWLRLVLNIIEETCYHVVMSELWGQDIGTKGEKCDSGHDKHSE